MCLLPGQSHLTLKDDEKQKLSKIYDKLEDWYILLTRISALKSSGNIDQYLNKLTDDLYDKIINCNKGESWILATGFETITQITLLWIMIVIIRMNGLMYLSMQTLNLIKSIHQQ